MSNSEPVSKIQIPCRHLRCKEMYHQAPGQADDQFSSGLYWCTRTHENFGPDAQPVDKETCCTGRPCFGR